MTPPRTLAAVVLLALAGCSVAPAPPERYYRVEVAPAAGAASPGGRIAVESFETYGIYNERALLFRAGSGALEQYHYQFWAEPPGVMLRDALVAYLRGAYGADRVLPAGGRARGDFTLRARLRKLEHLPGSPPQAALAVEFTVTDRDDQPRLTLAFDETAVAAGPSAEDFVAAMDQLVAKAYARLAERLRTSMESAPAP